MQLHRAAEGRATHPLSLLLTPAKPTLPWATRAAEEELCSLGSNALCYPPQNERSFSLTQRRATGAEDQRGVRAPAAPADPRRRDGVLRPPWLSGNVHRGHRPREPPL